MSCRQKRCVGGLKKVDEISKKLGQEGEYWEEVSGVRFRVGKVEIGAYFE